MTHFRIFVPLALLALACGGPAKQLPIEQDLVEEPDVPAPFFNGGGQDGQTTEVYPGPFGVGTGSVIPNYHFYGLARASLDKSKLVEIQLADFYNPTGTEVYGKDSPYGEGVAKPKALIIDRSAVWCGPCQQEAATTIPQARAKYASQGGEFFLVLDQGPAQGSKASPTDLTKWATKYNLDYPSALNPAETFSAIVGREAYPGNVLVRTRDMKIIKWVAGGPDTAFMKLFENVLADKPIPGID